MRSFLVLGHVSACQGSMEHHNLGSTRMYRHLHDVYWLNDMKRDIADFLSKCPNFQQVKLEHQTPGGMTQEIDIPIWKYEVNQY